MDERIALLQQKIEERKARKTPVLVALEGGSASGKSTLGAELARQLGATLIHMDDFFLPLELRTPERFAQPGGNVHWERVLAEVLQPLAAGKAPEYGVFDCSVMAVNRTVREEIRDVVIVEGAYSLHPALRDFYDLKVFLSVDKETQKARILARNGEKMLQRFLREWIPLEQAYFTACRVEECCDLVL